MDGRFRRATDRSRLPSGNTAYRHLWEYEAEMKELARRYPDLVRSFTLPHKTNEGRSVHGLEITSDVHATDGKPVYVMLGLHHAREWPAGEHTLEFAIDLLQSYGEDARITDLVNRVRTVFVPVVNPDGFNLSREAVPGHYFSTVAGLGGKRKNCRVVDGRDAVGGVCGLLEFRRPGCRSEPQLWRVLGRPRRGHEPGDGDLPWSRAILGTRNAGTSKTLSQNARRSC